MNIFRKTPWIWGFQNFFLVIDFLLKRARVDQRDGTDDRIYVWYEHPRPYGSIQARFQLRFHAFVVLTVQRAWWLHLQPPRARETQSHQA